MSNALTDLDLINAEVMGTGGRNPFGKDVQPGDEVSGEIVSVVRRHRRNSSGQPLFWVDRKPMVAADGDPVIDSQLIVETQSFADDQDDGLRVITLDRDVMRAISVGVRRARADGLAIGGKLNKLRYVGPAETGTGRVYSMEGYTAPTA